MKIKRLTSWILSIAMLIGITSFSGCDLKEWINNSTEQEEEIPDSLHYPEKWEIQFNDGFTYNVMQSNIYMKDLSLVVGIDCPQGKINIGDVRKNNQNLVITFSGEREWYAYYPALKVYYYNSRGEKVGPYYGGLSRSGYYKGEETLEELLALRKEGTRINWSYRQIRFSGIYLLQFEVYESEEEYKKTIYDRFYHPIILETLSLDVYAVVENRKLDET